MIPFCELQGPYTKELTADFERESRQWEYLPCPLNQGHKAARRRTGPLHHFVKHNDRSEHLIWGLEVAIHESVIASFRKEGFSGFRTKPAKITFQDGQTSDEYQEFIVTGWAGVVRPESGMRLLETCAGCHWKNYGPISDFNQVIDWGQWTGEDFFFVWPLTGNRLCTERVAKWLESSGVHSFAITRGFKSLEQRRRHLNYGIPRGALSDYLPEDLAIKYGRASGLE